MCRNILRQLNMVVSIFKILEYFMRLFWEVSIVPSENFQGCSEAGTSCGLISIVFIEPAYL